MWKGNFLLALYGHRFFQTEGSSVYYLLSFYDKNGQISSDVFKKVYTSLFSNELDMGSFLGPFNDLTFLEKYLIRIANKLNYKNVFFISVEEYNQLLLSAGNLEELQSLVINQAKRINLKEDGFTFFRRKKASLNVD